MAGLTLPTPPGPGYDVVVLYFRSPRTIVRTLHTVLAQDLPAGRILVVDNASADGLGSRLDDAGLLGRVELVTLTENMGYGAGMNHGARLLDGQGRRILFLTHEVELDRGCARLLSAALDGGFMLVGPLLHLTADRAPWSAGGELSRWGRARHVVDFDGSTRPCAWLDGSVLMTTAEAFDQLGGFDERYFLYWEDVDLGLRANRAKPSSVACVTAATAGQNTSMAAPRFDARNQILTWAHLHQPLRAGTAVLVHLAKAVDELMTQDRTRGRARFGGVLEGLRVAVRDGFTDARRRRRTGTP